MKTHQLTGVGPQSPDGSVELFTVLPTPFKVSKEWLAEQAVYPALGDELTEAEDGTLSLATEAAFAELQKNEAEPKKDGGNDLDDGWETSLVDRYVANPVIVHAVTIVSISAPANDDGTHDLKLSNGVIYRATSAQLARYVPVGGDYLVVQSDGYVYVNPKAVFEKKYSPLKE